MLLLGRFPVASISSWPKQSVPNADRCARQLKLPRTSRARSMPAVGLVSVHQAIEAGPENAAGSSIDFSRLSAMLPYS